MGPRHQNSFIYLRIRYLMKITFFDDFDMGQNVDVQVLIERIKWHFFTVSMITFPISTAYDSSSM